MYLEFNFSRGLFYAKVPNSKIFIWFTLDQHVWGTLALQGGDRFSRNSPFSAQGYTIEAGWSDTPAQKLLVLSWNGPENFIKILSFHQKLFNFFWRMDSHRHRHTRTHTHTHTHSHPNLDKQKILCPFYTFHFTTFVTHCVC